MNKGCLAHNELRETHASIMNKDLDHTVEIKKIKLYTEINILLKGVLTCKNKFLYPFFLSHEICESWKQKMKLEKWHQSIDSFIHNTELLESINYHGHRKSGSCPPGKI